MDDLILPVTYRNHDYEFPLRIVPRGYIYQFVIAMDGLDVIFERDEGGDFRAILPQPADDKQRLPEPGLLEAVISVLQQL